MMKHSNLVMQDNARPVIEVKCEIDKFRGFLHDVLSFEPDFILQSEKPRLHYYDEQLKMMLVHNLDNQSTQSISIRNPEIVPRNFSCIQAQNKIFLIGGELNENEIRTVVAKDCLVLNEQTYEVERRASMTYGKCGHQLAHFHRRYDFKTKDYIYAVGSKYSDDTNRKTEVYDVAKNKWFEVGELKQGRHYHSMCIVESRYLFVIAGRDSQTDAHLDTFEKLDCYADLDKQKWEAI